MYLREIYGTLWRGRDEDCRASYRVGTWFVSRRWFPPCSSGPGMCIIRGVWGTNVLIPVLGGGTTGFCWEDDRPRTGQAAKGCTTPGRGQPVLAPLSTTSWPGS